MRDIQRATALVRRHAAGVFVGLLLIGTAGAQDAHGPPAWEMQADPGVLVRGLISERDIELIFRHLRESMLGIPDGDGAGVARELAQRSDELRREIGVRGAALGFAILDLLERRAKDALRDSPFTAPLQASPAATSGLVD